MPWYTRPCLEWLKTIDLKGKKIFEYGVGYSTKWYESMGAIVWGVDDNKEWADKMNVSHQTNKHNYLQTITCFPKNYKFDIICIDGVFRDECAFYALGHIKKGGYIIIDNYKQATADLANWPLTEALIKDLDVKFYKEPTHEDWQTIVIHL